MEEWDLVKEFFENVHRQILIQKHTENYCVFPWKGGGAAEGLCS